MVKGIGNEVGREIWFKSHMGGVGTIRKFLSSYIMQL